MEYFIPLMLCKATNVASGLASLNSQDRAAAMHKKTAICLLNGPGVEQHNG